MTVFTCAHNWEAMLTCIYEAWASRLGHRNIRLEYEGDNQLTLMDEYIHVDADPAKAESVMDAINLKISPHVYTELAYESMSTEEDALDNIYRVLLLGFSLGPDVLKMVQYAAITRHIEIRRHVGNEAHHFIEFARFHEIRKSLFIAHIEPENRIVSALGPHFADRFPSEAWMIVDDVHGEALVHPADEQFYLKTLAPDELAVLRETERINDEYTDLWRVFFKSIAIKERMNYELQRNLFPLWKRKHAVEFDDIH